MTDLSKRTMTFIGVALGPVTLVILDLIFVGPEAPSEIVVGIRDSRWTAFIAYVVANFVGHWFHPIDDMQPLFGIPSPWNMVVDFAITGVWAVVFAVGIIPTAEISGWFPMVMAILGYVVGWLIWPVGPPEAA